MSVEKFQRPVVAPSFTPSAAGITSGNISTGAVTTAKLADGGVTNAKLGAGAVTLSKMKVFTANAETGTGSAQNVAHGLGTTPSFVVAIPTDGGTVVYGTHDSTNVKVTVTSTKKFDMIAIA